MHISQHSTVSDKLLNHGCVYDWQCSSKKRPAEYTPPFHTAQMHADTRHALSRLVNSSLNSTRTVHVWQPLSGIRSGQTATPHFPPSDEVFQLKQADIHGCFYPKVWPRLSAVHAQKQLQDMTVTGKMCVCGCIPSSKKKKKKSSNNRKILNTGARTVSEGRSHTAPAV